MPAAEIIVPSAIGLRIIDNGASRRRTQNAHFRARRADHADHSTTEASSRLYEYN